jgi:hypothetical protein
MKNKIPDNIVFTEEKGYHAHLTAFPTSVGAPVIKTDDVIAWKNRGINHVNHEIELKFNQLKAQFQLLMEEFEWNEIIYNAKFSFEPIVGQIYHLYINKEGGHFLSLIAPNEWNREHLGTFQLNHDMKWVKL